MAAAKNDGKAKASLALKEVGRSDGFANMLADAKQSLLSLAASSDGWKAFELKDAKDLSFCCKDVTATIKRQVRVTKDAPKGYLRKEKKYKMWRCVADINAKIDSAFHVLTDIPGAATWNSTVGAAKVLQVLDAQSDVTWLASRPNLGGAFAVRDFVGLRRIDKQPDGVYTVSTVGIVHPDIPLVHGNVRGWSGPGGFILRPLKNGRCRLTWILNADARPPGWIPQPLIDKGVATVMAQTIQGLRETAAKS